MAKKTFSSGIRENVSPALSFLDPGANHMSDETDEREERSAKPEKEAQESETGNKDFSEQAYSRSEKNKSESITASKKYHGYDIDMSTTKPDTETKTRRVSVLLLPSLYEDFKRQAVKEGRSFNNLVHIALADYLAAHKE